MDIIRQIEEEQKKDSLPELRVGDYVNIDYRIKEGQRERIQMFEGTVIKIQGEGVRKAFTVRRLSYGVGVERTFLLHSPRVENIKVVRHGKVRRSKLFYLRNRVGKAAKLREKTDY